MAISIGHSPDNHDETILEPKHVSATLFEGFTDFELDLSCLSTPPSPNSSVTELPPHSRTPSPPLFSPPSPPTQMLTSTRLAPSLSTSILRGSWPLHKYVGRGTPVDRHKTGEWGSLLSNEASEDGVLSTNAGNGARSNSLDSTRHSLSSEWNFVVGKQMSSSVSSSGHQNRQHQKQKELHHRSVPSRMPSRYKSSPAFRTVDEPPAAQIEVEGLGTNSAAEWEAVMQTVLEAAKPEAVPEEETETTPITGSTEIGKERTFVPAPSTLSHLDLEPIYPPLSAEEMRKLDPELVVTIDTDDNLDLALGPLPMQTGTNWVELLLPLLPQGAAARANGGNRDYESQATTASRGRDSPSIYSQAETAHTSPPPPSETHVNEESENRSEASAKAKVDATRASRASRRRHSRRWWNTVLGKMKFVHRLIRTHVGRS